MTMAKVVSLLKPMKSLQVTVFISTIWAEAEPTLMGALTKAIPKIMRRNMAEGMNGRPALAAPQAKSVALIF